MIIVNESEMFTRIVFSYIFFILSFQNNENPVITAGFFGVLNFFNFIKNEISSKPLDILSFEQNTGR